MSATLSPNQLESPHRNRAIRFVAWLEIAKGALVVLAGTGLLSLMHKDLHVLALKLIAHTHLNPASHYPQIFIDAAGRTGDGRLLTLALGAFTYALIRFVEAYGLFRERTWAELLAAISGAIYVPFELLGLARHVSWHGLIFLFVNLATVAIMVRAMRQRQSEKAMKIIPPQRSEEEARVALRELHDFLAAIPESSPDYKNASQGAKLVEPFLADPMDAYFYHHLCGMLAKGIGDWYWTEAVWLVLDPLMTKAAEKTHQHVHPADSGTVETM